MGEELGVVVASQVEVLAHCVRTITIVFPRPVYEALRTSSIRGQDGVGTSRPLGCGCYCQEKKIKENFFLSFLFL